jgi:multimeric flavodoxin WrbA
MGGPFRILGVCGSPRKGNTEILLDEALRSARAQKTIVTEKILLRGMAIKYCIGCFKCSEENRNELACQIHRDSMDDICRKLKECHGLILATPVYFGQVTAQMKTFMDRTEPLLRYGRGPWKSALRNKVGGAIAVGGNRNGGQETVNQSIHHFFFIHDMIVVGTGPDERPGCYLGAAATTHPQSGRHADGVKEDELGLRAARILGKRVAEVLHYLGGKEN